ncbi:hypothetical protein OEZ85_003128 [Tetradesmus obliquus]|uniref:Uncharacterized protein n=1 Tax=Tetradesmus obliquus TaxID=3088 RepID=A0ABY8U055_TETOB|nr:hypothetical protein OEZ85_003128 [Tetradesmus obliquus]
MADLGSQELKAFFKDCATVLQSGSSQDASDALQCLKLFAQDDQKWQASIEYGCWAESGVMLALVQRLQTAVDDEQQHTSLALLVTVLSLAARDADNSRST